MYTASHWSYWQGMWTHDISTEKGGKNVLLYFFYIFKLQDYSYTIKFTLLKCAISLVLYIHKIVQPSQLSSSRTFHHPPKHPYPWAFTCILPFPGPWQTLIHFLFLWVCPFWAFYINKIIQYMVFCVWLFTLHIVFFRGRSKYY